MSHLREYWQMIAYIQYVHPIKLHPHDTHGPSTHFQRYFTKAGLIPVLLLLFCEKNGPIVDKCSSQLVREYGGPTPFQSPKFFVGGFGTTTLPTSQNCVMPPCVGWALFFFQNQGSFYAANWLILANFDPNFVIPEISVNQVRKYLVCMLGGSGRLFMTACPAPIYFTLVRFSQMFARPEWSLKMLNLYRQQSCPDMPIDNLKATKKGAQLPTD